MKMLSGVDNILVVLGNRLPNKHWRIILPKIALSGLKSEKRKMARSLSDLRNRSETMQ